MRADDEFYKKLKRLKKDWLGSVSASAVVRALVDEKLAQLDKRK